VATKADILDASSTSSGYSAVVVTRNRKLLLAECVEAILFQTVAPDKLYIMDQASDDGTESHLESLGLLQNIRVCYIRSDTNQGGAGGFYWGMKRAHDDGAKWIWIMDDDAIPDNSAALKMMEMTRFPKVLAVGNQKLNRFHKVDSNHIVKMPGYDDEVPYQRLEFSSFVGLLVSRQAIDLIGLPKKELFFQEDDREYCDRILRHGDIAFSAESIIVHKNASAPNVQKCFRGKNYMRLESDKFCLKYFYWRNHLWRLLHRHPFEFVDIYRHLRALEREYRHVVFIDRDNTILRLCILTRATLDALRSRFDNEWAFKMQDKVMARRCSV